MKRARSMHGAARHFATGSLAAVLAALGAAPTLAQFAQRPFAVGGGEGGGAPSGGLTGWIMATQSSLTHLIAVDVKALHDNPTAMWGLVGIGFAYGVVHAAGPGHGKAVIASYMLASDRALKRGLVLAFLAALLQGAVAVALVGAAALIFNATSTEMNHAADWLALASYGGLIAIGLWLSWTKGQALIAALRARFAHRLALSAGALYAGAPWRRGAGSAGALSLRAYEPDPAAPNAAPASLSAAELAACGHAHAPDPSSLEAGFSWRGAAATVLAAGSRPCSGAILVLIFALAQGLFAAGVAAAFAMSLGVAVTTGALAVAAVFAQRLAMRLAAGDESRIALAARGVEFLAALLIVVFGVALLVGAQSMA